MTATMPARPDSADAAVSTVPVSSTSTDPAAREAVLARRVQLLVAGTITYNVIEAVVALTAGTRASSAALIGFGLDSVVEVSSAAAVAWQFSARTSEQRQQRERRALRIIAVSFFALAGYVGVQAVRALAGGTPAEHSTVGLVLAALSLLVMPVLSVAQRRAGRELGSRSAVADSKQTLLCTYLSAVLLVGLGVNSLFGWDWADPVAALVIAVIAVREGRQAWNGDGCCAPALPRAAASSPAACCTSSSTLATAATADTAGTAGTNQQPTQLLPLAGATGTAPAQAPGAAGCCASFDGDCCGLGQAPRLVPAGPGRSGRRGSGSLLMSGHSHGHGDHGHLPAAAATGLDADHRRRLLLVLAITTAVLAVEVVGAVLSGSLALLADAGHMLTDSAGLLIALIAAHLSLRPATSARTWGYRRAEVLAATVQAAVLLVVGVFVLVEGVRRLFEPSEVASTAMVVFGLVGLAGNAVAMLVLSRSRASNFNMRAAFLEVVNDALGSVAVLIAALVIATTGWLQADAIVSILIGLLILPRTLRLLRETAEVLLESTPRGLDLEHVRARMLALPHVHGVHDLHASQIATGLPVLTAHVVIDDSCFTDGHAPQMLDELQLSLARDFPVSVEHSTFQLEPVGHADHESAAHA